MKETTLKGLITQAEAENRRIGMIVTDMESKKEDMTPTEARAIMANRWRIMKESINNGLNQKKPSLSGLSGGDGALVKQAEPRYLCGVVKDAAAAAVAVAELNASMGRIVACPTAGSCGIVPAALTLAVERLGCSEEDVVTSMFTAAGVGIVCSLNASISGAEGGCMAECGVAGAMAAAALVELGGGTPAMIRDAVAICLTNMMGLVCDPVAGLVEVPCILRNPGALLQGLLAAELALAGVRSRIPVDEVIEAMKEVREALPESLRETGQGGLAATPTGRRIAERLSG